MPRAVTYALLALAVVLAGCIGVGTDAPTTDRTTATTTPPTTTTTTSQSPTTTSTPTESTTAPGTSRHPHVVSVSASPAANQSHNVTLVLRPFGGQQFNRTETVAPGDGFTVYRDHDQYEVTVIFDGETVVDEYTLHEYEALYVEITADGNVTTGLSQV